MAKREYQIISSDSHTLEPPDLWEKWLESKYLETAPKLVEDAHGGHGWIYMGGSSPEPLGLVSCVDVRPEDLKWTGARYGAPTNSAQREIHPGCYLGDKRLEILDLLCQGKRTVETLAQGAPKTPFLKAGDLVRMEMRDARRHSIFGAIEQEVQAA